MMALDRVVMYSWSRALISALTTARAVWRVKCSVVMNCMICCRSAPAGGPSTGSEGAQQGRVLEQVAEVGQELGGVGAVDDAVVEGDRGRHELADGQLAVDHPGAGGD